MNNLYKQNNKLLRKGNERLYFVQRKITVSPKKSILFNQFLRFQIFLCFKLCKCLENAGTIIYILQFLKTFKFKNHFAVDPLIKGVKGLITENTYVHCWHILAH